MAIGDHMSLYYNYLFEKAYKDVLSVNSFEELISKHHLLQHREFNKESEIYRTFQAIRARPDKQFYTAQSLILPEALTWDDLFEDYKIELEHVKPPQYVYTSTRTYRALTTDGYQTDKNGRTRYYHLYTKPTIQVIEAERTYLGDGISNFEIIERDDGFLILIGSTPRTPEGYSSGFTFTRYLALIDELPDSLVVKNTTT
jgi:hypothetical protein